MDQTNINGIVWKAYNSLRGKIDPLQYKDYVLTLLFIKYLSDLWKDKRTFYVDKYNGDATRVERALRNEYFRLPDNCTFEYIYTKRSESNLGEIIDIVLTGLEDANRAKLANVFRNISFNSEAIFGQTKERNTILKNLLVLS